MSYAENIHEEQIENLKEQINLNARVACEALTVIEKYTMNDPALQEKFVLSSETRAWWKAHQAKDRERKAGNTKKLLDIINKMKNDVNFSDILEALK